MVESVEFPEARGVGKHLMNVSIEQWRERGHFSRLLGREIFYVDSGELDKPVVLFILTSWPTTMAPRSLRSSLRGRTKGRAQAAGCPFAS